MELLNNDDRPPGVTLAIKLLFTVMCIGLVQLAMLVVRHFGVRSPTVPIVVQLGLFAVGFYLLVQIGKGQNWSRWSLLVILGVSIPLKLLPTFQSIAHYPVYGLLEILQLILYLWALVLLLQKSSSDWFQGK